MSDEKEKKKVPGYFFEPQIAPTEGERFFEIHLGIIVASGTVGDDILSGGVGIVNDAPAFWIASKLIFGY